MDIADGNKVPTLSTKRCILAALIKILCFIKQQARRLAMHEDMNQKYMMSPQIRTGFFFSCSFSSQLPILAMSLYQSNASSFIYKKNVISLFKNTDLLEFGV